MEHENYTFPEAIRFLAKKYGIEIEETEQTEEDKERIQEKESLFLINEFAKEFFHSELIDSDEGKSVGLSYFNKRGILNKTIKDFHLGYSPLDKKALINLADSKGYKSEYLEKLGLKSRSGLDFFRSRIIFPITNLSGKVIAFGGRTLSSDKKIPKYLNSPESDIYNKSKSLYGIFQSKNQIRRSNNCYIVEGYTDVLSLHQNEVKNAVASSGTALTSDQLRVIKRFCTNITFLYDGDNAGQKAALRGLPLALSEDLDVKIVPLDESQDPDSLIQELGAAQFQQYLADNTQDFIVYQAKNINTKFKSLPIEKSQAIKDLIEILANISDPIKRSIYVKEVTGILKVNEESFIGELNKKIRKNLNYKKRTQLQNRPTDQEEEAFINQKPNSANQSVTVELNDYHQERDLIRILMIGGKEYSEQHESSIAEFIVDNTSEVLDTFQNDTFKRILMEAKNHLSKGSEMALYRFMLKKIQDKIKVVENEIKRKDLNQEQLKVLLVAKGKLDNSRREIAISQGNIVL